MSAIVATSKIILHQLSLTLKLKDLTTKLLQDFYNYKQNTQGLSPKTILNLHRCLHKAMNQAVLEHYIDFNPCDAVSLPRNAKTTGRDSHP